jgi:hypothetical protein
MEQAHARLPLYESQRHQISNHKIITLKLKQHEEISENDAPEHQQQEEQQV